ncbi:MAG: cryptochrome/photolyase family protein, partial [Bacteroidota bacterium]
MPKTLKLLLGDQLNYEHSWFREVNPEVSYVMMEILPETRYVKHHIQKLLAFFGAMRCFRDFMQAQGHHFIYFTIDDSHNQHRFSENLKSLIEENNFELLQYQEPDEYRLDQLLGSLNDELSIPTEMVSSEHFLSERWEVKDFFKGKKSYLLESFYRYMRKKYDVLMEGSQPYSGKWNYDADNRNKYKGEVPLPRLKIDSPDIKEIYQAILK